MSTMFATVGALVIKSVAASRDTVFVAASGGAFPMIAAVTQEITALALVVLAAVVVPVALGLRRVDRKLNALLDRAQRDIDPVMQHARAITDNVNAITVSVRSQVDQVNETITKANEGVQQALGAAEQRISDLNALIAVMQDEAEELFVSAASTVHGVRDGAASYRAGSKEQRLRRERTSNERSGTDLAFDELDAAALADAIETQEEQDGHDDSTEPAAQTHQGTPRLQPRARRPRRA